MAVISILAAILLLSIGLALMQAVNALFARERRYYSGHYRRDLALVDIVVFIMYALVAGMVVMLYVAFGYEPIVLYAALALLVGLAVVLLAKYLLAHRETMDRTGVILYFLWLGVVLYLTLFSRAGSEGPSRAMMTPFRGLTQAIAERSLAPLQHTLLNVLLFVPFGLFIPRVNPRLSHAGLVLLSGIVTSTLIEGLQFILGLGFCDIDDIIANSLGAIAGYGLYSLFRKIGSNWRLS